MEASTKFTENSCRGFIIPPLQSRGGILESPWSSVRLFVCLSVRLWTQICPANFPYSFRCTTFKLSHIVMHDMKLCMCDLYSHMIQNGRLAAILDFNLWSELLPHLLTDCYETLHSITTWWVVVHDTFFYVTFKMADWRHLFSSP